MKRQKEIASSQDLDNIKTYQTFEYDNISATNTKIGEYMMHVCTN
jgi:hypothetical protein